MLRTNPLTDSSTNATQIVVEYDELDDGGGARVPVQKSDKGLNHEPDLLKLRSSDLFILRHFDPTLLKLFVMGTKSLGCGQFRGARKLSQYNFQIDYRQGKADGAADALSQFSQRSTNKEVLQPENIKIL